MRSPESMTSTHAIGCGIRFAEAELVIRAAVEQVAATDPRPDDPFRGLYVSDELALTLARDPSGGDLDDRLTEAVDRLGLEVLDARVLVLALAGELDPRYGRLFGYLHDDLTRKFASPRLIARLLVADGVDEHRVLSCLRRDGRLRRSGALRLLEADGQVALAERPIKVADRLTSFVLGVSLDAGGGAGRARHVQLPTTELGRPDVVTELRRVWETASQLPVAAVGSDAAEILAVAIGTPLLVADVRLAGDHEAIADLALAAALEGCCLCFEGADDLPGPERPAVVAALLACEDRVAVCASGREAIVALDGLGAIPIDVPPPSFGERCVLWSAQTGAGEVGDVAAKFRLDAAQIAHAAELARLSAAARSCVVPAPSDLERGARQASSRRLDGLAVRVQPRDRFDDLILPDRQIGWLKSISAYLRHRDLVLSGWGYNAVAGTGQGLKALFFGDSGTGKTMAGRVLANELGLEMYRIDLAAVVSKYIGETEKNLGRIFEAADGSNAILFFDEADALFGKRSDVGDAHDRYANIEVAYLLQRIEGYPGAVILATNFRNNIDDAFLRRLDFAIEFPFPEAEHRAAIWRRMLPDAAPVADDLDFDTLAGQHKLSGGSIRNCSIAAAFLAADDGGRIEMRHLRQAVSFEYAKLGRLPLNVEPAVDAAAVI
ncbi:MAG TPA: ATP-binding protein [Solirubrobacteraceae bacterium]|nr:ATP-binding protein [Solirubrobacteraceae bacterium]